MNSSSSSTFHPDTPIFETDLKKSAEQIKNETRRAEASDDTKKNVQVESSYTYMYDFADEFGRAWTGIFVDVFGLRGVPTVPLIERIFLSDDRKMFVGTFLILLAVVYLFVVGAS